MFLIPRLIPILVIVALLAAQQVIGAQASGSRCLKIAEVEMCLDPTLAAKTDGKGEVSGKKCFDAVLDSVASASIAAESEPYPFRATTVVTRSSPDTVWRPPRLSA